MTSEQLALLRRWSALRREAIQGNARFLRRNPALVRELRKRGLAVNATFELENYIGSEQDPQFVEAIVAALASPRGLADRVTVACMLQGTRAPFDGNVLVEMLEAAEDERDKRMIAHAIAQSGATGVDEWIEKVMHDRSYGGVRIVVLGIASATPRVKGMAGVLMEAYEDVALDAAEALGKIGGARELEFLRSKQGWLPEAPKYKQTEYARLHRQAIARIEKRLERQQERDQRRLEREREKEERRLARQGERERLKKEKEGKTKGKKG